MTELPQQEDSYSKSIRNSNEGSRKLLAAQLREGQHAIKSELQYWQIVDRLRAEGYYP